MPSSLTVLFVCALAVFPTAAAARDLQGAGWHHCAAWTLTRSSGADVRVTQLHARGVSCRRTRSVLRNFYSQPIGSSGGTYALGYACNYTRVDAVCRKGSRHFRWHETLASSASRRSCGTVSVTLSPGDTRYARRITTRNVTCKRARRLARAVTADPGEGGIYQTFRCDGTNDGSGGGTITCRKGSGWVHWRY